MIGTILKREILNYLKNPIYYIGAVLVFINIYSYAAPYLNIHYFTRENEIKILDYDTGLADADIMDGYIPVSVKEMYQLGLDRIGNVLDEELNMTTEDAQAVVQKLKESNMSIDQMAAYLEEHYSFGGAQLYFYKKCIKKATVEEANSYIKSELKKESYSSYFSRKYVDYFAVCLVFYAIVLFAFLFLKESKKDIYELLHTKPIEPWKYIAGKIAGGLAAILLAAGIITVIFDVMVVSHGITAGFPVSVWDLWYALLIYILPDLLMVISVYTVVAILFKNPLPAAPALVLYVIYSNMGSRVSEDCPTSYRIPKLAIMVRFADTFFETTVPAQAVINQIFLVGASVLMMIISSMIWKRRRHF